LRMPGHVRLRKLLARLMTPKDWIATFVAVLALTTAVWSGVATRTYNRLAARPHLQVGESFATSSSRLGSQIANQGPGIAIIDDFNLCLDGNPLSGDWAEQWEQFRKATGTEDWTDRGALQKVRYLPQALRRYSSSSTRRSSIQITVRNGNSSPTV